MYCNIFTTESSELYKMCSRKDGSFNTYFGNLPPDDSSVDKLVLNLATREQCS